MVRDFSTGFVKSALLPAPMVAWLLSPSVVSCHRALERCNRFGCAWPNEIKGGSFSGTFVFPSELSSYPLVVLSTHSNRGQSSHQLWVALGRFSNRINERIPLVLRENSRYVTRWFLLVHCGVQLLSRCVSIEERWGCGGSAKLNARKTTTEYVEKPERQCLRSMALRYTSLFCADWNLLVAHLESCYDDDPWLDRSTRLYFAPFILPRLPLHKSPTGLAKWLALNL